MMDDQVAYSVDRADNWRLRYMGDLPGWAATRWHRCRPDDEALAACSWRIVLNIEDRTPVGALQSADLCRRCWPTVPPRRTEQ